MYRYMRINMHIREANVTHTHTEHVNAIYCDHYCELVSTGALFVFVVWLYRCLFVCVLLCRMLDPVWSRSMTLAYDLSNSPPQGFCPHGKPSFRLTSGRGRKSFRKGFPYSTRATEHLSPFSPQSLTQGCREARRGDVLEACHEGRPQRRRFVPEGTMVLPFLGIRKQVTL